MDAITVISNIYIIASHGAVAKRNVGRATEREREREKRARRDLHTRTPFHTKRERERESLLVTREPIPKRG